ncbi:MAG: Ig-like domain-containing protein, partial [Pseudomonadota bacterium]|nr:Ig-like domain-containing protein [Pseudomonadota bacterium]
MKNITIVDKATGTATEHAFGNASLKGTSIVKLPFGQESVQSFQQSGQNLVVTLKSGETITIQNFFVVGADGAANQLVLENADGTLLLGNYSTPYSGFNFTEISTLDDLGVAAIAADSAVPDWVLWGLGILAVGGTAAALSGGGGGGGHHHQTPVPAPGAATGLSVNSAGTVVSGKGQPGTTVTVKDATGNVLGTGTVGTDGNFQVNLDKPQTNGETLQVVLKDAAGQESQPASVVAGDTTAPAAPNGLAVSADGTTVSGKGEPNSTVIIKDANGEVLGTGTVDAEGNFQVTLGTAQTNGETLQVTLKDAAGNESSASPVVAGDSTAPDAPTNLVISADGATVSGKGEPNAAVSIKDASGNVIGTGTVGADGNFQVSLDTPASEGESLAITLKDAAGNESAPGALVVADIETPLAPRNLAISDVGDTLSGEGAAAHKVIVLNDAGEVVGSGTVADDGTFLVQLNSLHINGERLRVFLRNFSGKESLPGIVIAGDTIAPDAPTNLVVGEDGSTVTGKGEPRATVTVKDADGNVIGTGTVGDDGNFQVTLDPLQVNGETLAVTLTDAAGNESVPASVIAVDIDDTDA